MKLSRSLALVLPTALLAACGGEGDELSSRQREVAVRGAEVMPFDLDATTHRFQETDRGLVQLVVADDPNDANQVALVRDHLRKEARRFEQGDFTDPQAIHGEDMPGVQKLARNPGEVHVRYRPAPAGAQIVFRASSERLVQALHTWAAAQVQDHGEHADHG